MKKGTLKKKENRTENIIKSEKKKKKTIFVQNKKFKKAEINFLSLKFCVIKK